jgi:hypothetical protein
LIIDSPKWIDGKNTQSNSLYWDQFKGLTFPQFWDYVGRPLKNGEPQPIFDYEELVYSTTFQDAPGDIKNKHVFILKATGLGITEFVIRLMAWLATRDDSKREMCIVTGPNIELAIGIIKRLRDLFKDYEFDTKETVAIINHCRVEAFPSHHLDAMRSLFPDFILLDEADFFPPGEQENARAVSERYIGKSNPFLFVVSTPNLPGGLCQAIEGESEPSCLYHRLRMPYAIGIGKIYTEEDIKRAKASPTFEREYNLQYGMGVGNIFPWSLLTECCNEPYDLSLKGGYKGLALDPAYGSSKFAEVGGENLNGIIYIKDANQFERASPSAMLARAVIQATKYDKNVVIDSAHPGLITDLKEKGINARAIQFGHITENKNTWISEATIKAAEYVKTGKVKIHPSCEALIQQLRAVTFNEKGHPDKKKLTFDLGDAFIMLIDMLASGEIGYMELDPD